MSFSDSPMFQRTRICTTFLRIFSLSILWLLTSLPLVTFGPASMAAYHTCVKVIRRDRGKLLPEFFRAFRTNFRNGFLAGGLFLILTALLVLGTQVSSILAADSQIWVVLSYVYFLLLMLLCVALMFVIPFFSRFQMPFGKGLLLSLVSLFQHLFTAVTCFLVWVLGYQIFRFLPAMILILPGCCFLVCSLVIEPILKKHTVISEASDPWYME